MKIKILVTLAFLPFVLISQTIFQNDFSDPNDWTMLDILHGGAQNWVITTSGPIGPYSGNMDPISSTTSANGFALYDSDGLNTTGAGSQDALLTYNGSVDCSAYNSININFESYHKKFNNLIYLEVTTDSNWINYSQFEINSTLQSTYATPNPEVVSFDITTVAANQSAVYFRFRYLGGDDYAWMIDDVSFTEIPNNSLTIDSETFGGGLLGSGIDYTFTPIGQTSFSPYKFEAVIKNEGVEAQHNVMLNVSVQDPALSTALYISSGISLSPSQAYTMASTTSFTPSNIGLHEFTYWGSSDSTSSNTTVRKAMVTDSVYAVDFDWDSDGSTITGGGYYSGAACGGQVLGNTFDIYDNAVVTSISFHVNSSSTPGAELNVELYEAIGKTLVAESDNYILTANDIGSWVTLQLVNPYLALSGRPYIAAVRGNQHPTNSSMISSAFSTMNSSSWLLDGGCHGSAGTWFTLSHSLLIRMNLPSCTSSNTINEIACDSYTWGENGETYTASGVFTELSTNSLGCTHTEILNLTINSSTSTNIIKESCETYTWPVNEITYDQSGTYSYITTNIDGCVHTETLDLAINTVHASIQQDGQGLYAITTPVDVNSVAWYNIQGDKTWLMSGNSLTFLPRFDCSYFIVVEDEFGCIDTSDVYNFGEFARRIGFIETSPNPTNGTLNVKFENAKHQFVKLLLINGKGVKFDEFISTDNELDIDISKYPSGIYYLYFNPSEDQTDCNPSDKEILYNKIILNK